MTPSGYSEDALIEQPAIVLLAKMGWETVNAYREFDHGASTLGRETKSEVILIARLRPALQRLNPDVSPEAINQAIEELSRDLLLSRHNSCEVDVSELEITIPQEGKA
ncbi:MAG: type I restriction endonuclease [bacterium]